MGKIKKILENELLGGTTSNDVYPITSTQAIYTSKNEKLSDSYVKNVSCEPSEGGVSLILKSESDTTVNTTAIPAATTEKAGVMTAEDKHTLGKTVSQKDLMSFMQGIDDKGLYICDEEGNIVASIDKDGKLNVLDFGDTTIENLADKLANSINITQIEINTRSIEEIKKVQENINEKLSQIELTNEEGFYICDTEGNVVFKVEYDGNTKFINQKLESSSKDESIYSQVNQLTKDIVDIKAKADVVDSLITIKKSGEYFSSTITIPPSYKDRKNVILRVGLHYGNPIGKQDKSYVYQSDTYNDVFFNEKCEKNFSDVRFSNDGNVLNHRLEHFGNYEVVRDNNFNPGNNFGIDYETNTIYQGSRYSSDGGITWLTIPNWNSGNIVFVDSRKILYSIDGSKVFITPRINNEYNGSNTIEICDVTVTSTGSYNSAYPTQGSRAIVEDNKGYIYFGTNGPEYNAVIFRSINPDMTPTNGVYVKEVFNQPKVYKEDGSLNYEVVDQHVHNFYYHKETGTLYAGLDNSNRPYGPRVIKTTNNGASWEEVIINSEEWTLQRGRDYIPAYISPDGSYMLGGGEVNILGGQTLCKVYTDNNNGKIVEKSIKGIVNNGTGLRAISSFGEDFIIAGLNAGSGGNSDIQLLLSRDKGNSFNTIYSENVPLSINAAGMGVRWFSDPFSPNGEDERILITGMGVSTTSPCSPLVVYHGGNHYYGEAYVYVGDIKANEIKTLTVESGYMVQMPNVIREHRIEPIYSIPLNEGAGNVVYDSMGNAHTIQGDFVWDSYNVDVRYGGHWPIIKDVNCLHGIKLEGNAFIELGKIKGLDFNKGFTITFWYKWDSNYVVGNPEFNSIYYDKIGAIISSENFNIGFYRGGYLIGNTTTNIRGTGCRTVHKGMYEFVCLSAKVGESGLPEIVISRNDDYGKQSSVKIPTSWDFDNMSKMILRVGTPSMAKNINYPIYISNINIYDKVMDLEEVQFLYKGGTRL